MNNKMETEDYKFIVKNPWGENLITIEPMRKEISVFENAILSFNLRDGVTEAQVHKLAKDLNNLIKDISYQKT
tara:strand:- start:18203 stop:18421 length:219 start_codon:yes stop_codon:yes gene_type:complete